MFQIHFLDGYFSESYSGINLLSLSGLLQNPITLIFSTPQCVAR